MLKGLISVAVLALVLGLDLAPVTHLQLLILPSFRAVLGALFSLFPSKNSLLVLLCRTLLYFVNLHVSNCKGIRKLVNNLEIILNLKSRSKTRTRQPKNVPLLQQQYVKYEYKSSQKGRSSLSAEAVKYTYHSGCKLYSKETSEQLSSTDHRHSHNCHEIHC